jgi:hypothetical protein
MTEVRSTSTARVKAHRARKRVGVQKVVIELSERQIDRLAAKGYLDGDNTVAQGQQQPKLHAIHRRRVLRAIPAAAWQLPSALSHRVSEQLPYFSADLGHARPGLCRCLSA